jgi:L-malate glycosyltransferase
MSKPRILIVENSIAITGALKSIIRSSQHLLNDFTFIFLLPENSTAVDVVRDAGFEVHTMRMRELRKDFFSALGYLPVLLYNSFALKGFVRKHKISLIISNDLYNLMPAMSKMLGGNIPYICYVRFLPSRFPKQLVRFWCAWHHRYASNIIAVSKAVERELPHHDDVVVIGNELPSEDVHYIPAENSTTILYPSNYIRGKGQEMALQSFALISPKYPQWKLRFVGGDMGLAKNKQFKDDLIKLCQSLKLDGQTEWHSA